MNQLRAWLDKTLTTVPPAGNLGQALRYLYKYWSKLIRYTERGELPIDNNQAENAIRPFVVGHKNWLFSDTPQGAHASALIYSDRNSESQRTGAVYVFTPTLYSTANGQYYRSD